MVKVMKSLLAVMIFCLAGCMFPIYYNVTDCPEANELVNHRYVTKGDLFLLEADVVGPYIGMVYPKYMLKPPGYFNGTPKDIDLYWKYGNDWADHEGGRKRLSKPRTIVAVIPKGTVLRVTHVQQKSSSSIQEDFNSFYGFLDDYRFRGDLIEFCGIIDVFELPFGGHTVLIDEHFLEAVDNDKS